MDEDAHVRTRTIEIGVPLDLRGTLRPLHGSFADDGWWLSARTPDGPGSLRISRSTGQLSGEAWGDGSEWLLDRLGGIAGLDDAPESFEPDHPLIADLHRRHPGVRFARTGLVFDALVIAVCGQKVTGREAAAAVRGLYRAFSEPAPGPNKRLRLPPDPLQMAEAPYYVFHELHLEKRRAEVLRRLAQSADTIDRLAATDPGVAESALLGFDGIGAWTTAKTLSVSHGDPDQVPVGDFHTKHLVSHHLTGKDRATDQEMLELLEPYRPHRGRVIRLLHTLGHAPKFGPRMTPRDITRL